MNTMWPMRPFSISNPFTPFQYIQNTQTIPIQSTFVNMYLENFRCYFVDVCYSRSMFKTITHIHKTQDQFRKVSHEWKKNGRERSEKEPPMCIFCNQMEFYHAKNLHWSCFVSRINQKKNDGSGQTSLSWMKTIVMVKVRQKKMWIKKCIYILQWHDNNAENQLNPLRIACNIDCIYCVI